MAASEGSRFCVPGECVSKVPRERDTETVFLGSGLAQGSSALSRGHGRKASAANGSDVCVVVRTTKAGVLKQKHTASSKR